MIYCTECRHWHGNSHFAHTHNSEDQIMGPTKYDSKRFVKQDDGTIMDTQMDPKVLAAQQDYEAASKGKRKPARPISLARAFKDEREAIERARQDSVTDPETEEDDNG